MDIAIHLFYLTIIISGALILAALGDFLSEQAGILNLGIEGLMSLGAITVIILTLSGLTVWAALLMTCITGLIWGVIFSTATVIFKADQALCGLSITMLGIGIANFIGKPFENMVSVQHLQNFPIPFLSSIPFLGPTVFSQNPISYGIYLVFIPLVYFFLFKTRYGLYARAVGENPEAAHSAGISVNRLRFIYSCLGTMLATVAGGYLILSTTYSWSKGFISGKGWVAIALVLLGQYRILYILIAGLCFGFISSLGFEERIFHWPISPIVLNIILYLSIIIFSILPRCIPAMHRKTRKPPASLAIPFFHSNHR